jgi:hypothetical protein
MSSHITEATLEACGIPAGTRVMPGDPDSAVDLKGRRHDGSAEGGDAAAAVVPYFPGVGRAGYHFAPRYYNVRKKRAPVDDSRCGPRNQSDTPRE